jgi:hypothetical protein
MAEDNLPAVPPSEPPVPLRPSIVVPPSKSNQQWKAAILLFGGALSQIAAQFFSNYLTARGYLNVDVARFFLLISGSAISLLIVLCVMAFDIKRKLITIGSGVILVAATSVGLEIFAPKPTPPVQTKVAPINDGGQNREPPRATSAIPSTPPVKQERNRNPTPDEIATAIAKRLPSTPDTGNLRDRTLGLSKEIASYLRMREEALPTLYEHQAAGTNRWEVYGPWERSTVVNFRSLYLPRVIAIRDECAGFHVMDTELDKELEFLKIVPQQVPGPYQGAFAYVPPPDSIKKIGNRLAVLGSLVK